MNECIHLTNTNVGQHITSSRSEKIRIISRPSAAAAVCRGAPASPSTAPPPPPWPRPSRARRRHQRTPRPHWSGDEEEAGARGGGEADAVPPFPTPVRSVSTLVTVCRKKRSNLCLMSGPRQMLTAGGMCRFYMATTTRSWRSRWTRGAAEEGAAAGPATAQGRGEGETARPPRWRGEPGGSFVLARGREGSEWVPQSRGWRRDPSVEGMERGF
jgi:hypothetical protein